MAHSARRISRHSASQSPTKAGNIPLEKSYQLSRCETLPPNLHNLPRWPPHCKAVREICSNLGIVIPRALINGLALAVHLKFDHPSPHQLKQIMKRAFYAIGMDQVIDDLSINCSQCAALRTIPNHLMEQSTECPPYAVGMNFAADVLKRERQLIFITREQVTSYTQAIIIPNERHESLRDAIIQLAVVLKPTNGPPTIVRVDPALIWDRLTRKIRHPGISSKEIVTKRDQFTNQQLPLRILISSCRNTSSTSGTTIPVPNQSQPTLPRYPRT